MHPAKEHKIHPFRSGDEFRNLRVKTTGPRQKAWALFAGLVIISMLWGCAPSYSQLVLDTGVRPIIQVIPDRYWEEEVPMCPNCLAVTAKLSQHNYVIKVRWGEWDALEHEFRHVWDWETKGTTDHILTAPDEKPNEYDVSASTK